jgi:hypothetical protein
MAIGQFIYDDTNGRRQTLVDPQSDVCLSLSGIVGSAQNLTDSTVFLYREGSCLGDPILVLRPGMPAPLLGFPFDSLKFQGP